VSEHDNLAQCNGMMPKYQRDAIVAAAYEAFFGRTVMAEAFRRAGGYGNLDNLKPSN
jgi:hypothetical protein